MNEHTTLPLIRRTRRRFLPLVATAGLILGASAWADTDVPDDELEVTLEVFDDAQALEAFEVHLSAPDDQTSPDADGQDALLDRMARFEDEVSRASESDGQALADREDEEREAEREREDALVREHESDHQERIGEFDQADEMDEVDLAEPSDEEPAGMDEESPMDDDLAADEEATADDAADVMEDGEDALDGEEDGLENASVNDEVAAEADDVPG